MLLVGPDLLKAYDREAKGVPIGRPAAVNLRNNHTQYIFTWLVSPYYPQLLPFAGESVFETMKLILCVCLGMLCQPQQRLCCGWSSESLLQK